MHITTTATTNKGVVLHSLALQSTWNSTRWNEAKISIYCSDDIESVDRFLAGFSGSVTSSNLPFRKKSTS